MISGNADGLRTLRPPVGVGWIQIICGFALAHGDEVLKENREGQPKLVRAGKNSKNILTRVTNLENAIAVGHQLQNRCGPAPQQVAFTAAKPQMRFQMRRMRQL